MFPSINSLFALLVAAAAVASAARDTSFPACDRPDGTPEPKAGYKKQDPKMITGKAKPWGPGLDYGSHNPGLEFTSTDPVFYTAPGLGSCGVNYTDADAVACLKPGWINSAYQNGCNKWIEASLPALGTKVTARVIDTCGAVADTSFDCGDLYLSLAAYSGLAQGNQTIINAGRLPGNVTWHFIKEPCWACEAGLDGKLPHGQVDDCKGRDSWGEPRTGRKTGKDIKTGAAAGEACASIDVATKFDVSQFKSAADKQIAAAAATAGDKN